MNKVKKKTINLTSHKNWLTALAVAFFIYSLTLILPLLWLIYNSLKSKTEFYFEPWALPENPIKYLGNYVTVFKDFGIGEMFLNSLILSLCAPLISVFFHSCAAYAYARHSFKLKGLVYALAITPMVVSIAGTLPATYKLICDLRFYDNILLFLLVYTQGYGMNFLLISSVFQNISGTYKEAALIDGAGYWRIFVTIYIPQASNIIVSLYILGFIGIWNDYQTPYLYLPSYNTLSTGIYKIQELLEVGGSEYSNDYPRLYAAMVLSILPVLVLFVAFQDKIMNMVMGGGVKE